MENFRRGFLNRLGFECSRGLLFDTVRYGLYKNIAGGFYSSPEGVDC